MNIPSPVTSIYKHICAHIPGFSSVTISTLLPPSFAEPPPPLPLHTNTHILSLSLFVCECGKMQGAAIAFSPSLSLSVNPRRIAAPRFNPISLPSSDHLRLRNGSSQSFLSSSSSSQKLSTPIACSLKQSGPVPGPDHGSSKEQSDGVLVRAAAESAAAAETPKLNSFVETLVLAALFGFWIVFNIYFNIYNKQVVISFFIYLFLFCFVVLLLIYFTDIGF